MFSTADCQVLRTPVLPFRLSLTVHVPECSYIISKRLLGSASYCLLSLSQHFRLVSKSVGNTCSLVSHLIYTNSLRFGVELVFVNKDRHLKLAHLFCRCRARCVGESETRGVGDEGPPLSFTTLTQFPPASHHTRVASLPTTSTT